MKNQGDAEGFDPAFSGYIPFCGNACRRQRNRLRMRPSARLCPAPTDNVSELTARTNDEGWESVFAKDNAAAQDFRTYPYKTTHRGTYCVWELGAVWHEQQAWRRYLLSQRDEAAKRVYLADHYRGPV